MPSVTVGDPDEPVPDAGPICEWGAAAPSVESRIMETTRSANARPLLPCSWKPPFRFCGCIGTMNRFILVLVVVLLLEAKPSNRGGGRERRRGEKDRSRRACAERRRLLCVSVNARWV